MFGRLKKWENPPPFANLIDIDFPVVPASGKRTHARHGGDANVGIAGSSSKDAQTPRYHRISR